MHSHLHNPNPRLGLHLPLSASPKLLLARLPSFMPVTARTPLASCSDEGHMAQYNADEPSSFILSPVPKHYARSRS